MLKSDALSEADADAYGAEEEIPPFTWVARLTIPLAVIGLLGVVIPVFRVASGSSELPLDPGTEFKVELPEDPEAAVAALGSYVFGFVIGHVQRIRDHLGLISLSHSEASEARELLSVEAQRDLDMGFFARGLGNGRRDDPPALPLELGPLLARPEMLGAVFEDLEALEDPDRLYDSWQHAVSLAGWLKAQGASDDDVAWCREQTRTLLDRVIRLDPSNAPARESRGDLLYEGELAEILEREDLEPSERTRIEALERILQRQAAEDGGWISGEDLRRLEAVLDRYEGR